MIMSSHGRRGHVAKQQVPLGNSPDANAERQLRKRVPVVAPLVQRLLFGQELFELAFRRRQIKVMPFNSTGITLTAG